MKRVMIMLLALALSGVMQLPAGAQTKMDDFKAPPPTKQAPPKVAAPAPPAGPSFRHLNGDRILFVANGVRGSSRLSDALIEASSDMHLGLRVQMVAWTRTLSAFEDLNDREAQMRAACNMAGLAQCVRRDCPNSPIFFLGHSAGAHVALLAAAMMPEKSIDRVILLHAAVSCTYDLKPTLKASRGGVDNFFSSEDPVLATVIEQSTTADGTKIACAGRVAFRIAHPSPEEIAAYRNVRQYRWIEEMTGNGGHYAWTLQPNLKKCVVPLLFYAPAPVSTAAPAPPPLIVPPAIKTK